MNEIDHESALKTSVKKALDNHVESLDSETLSKIGSARRQPHKNPFRNLRIVQSWQYPPRGRRSNWLDQKQPVTPIHPLHNYLPTNRHAANMGQVDNR